MHECSFEAAPFARLLTLAGQMDVGRPREVDAQAAGAVASVDEAI